MWEKKKTKTHGPIASNPLDPLLAALAHFNSASEQDKRIVALYEVGAPRVLLCAQSFLVLTRLSVAGTDPVDGSRSGARVRGADGRAAEAERAPSHRAVQGRLRQRHRGRRVVRQGWDAGADAVLRHDQAPVQAVHVPPNLPRERDCCPPQ
eukprot:477479-Rhodomonas_salina.1